MGLPLVEESASILMMPTEEMSASRSQRIKRFSTTETRANEIPLPTKNKIGTFAGVFVPTVIGTLGGVVMLRLSWIVGQTGLSHALIMYAIIVLVSWITDLSMSAIASNGEIKTDLVSRSLGAEFGGSWGVIFFGANILGCAYYTLGLVEAIFETFNLDEHYLTGVAIGSVALFIFMLIVLLGAKFFTKALVVIFAMLFLSIALVFISFLYKDPGKEARGEYPAGFTGPNFHNLVSNWSPHYTRDSSGTDYNFRIMLGLLLPSVTGLMTGYTLSGDLARPGISLQSGNTWASAVTFTIYIALTIVFTASVTHDTLTANPYVPQRVCLVPWLLDIGVFAAVSSSALATLLGAARTLQAIANDKLFPLHIFRKGSLKGNEPRRAVLCCWLMVQALIFLPDLDMLAPYIGMLYLLSYLIINIACFISDVSGVPNFRPSFMFYHWTTAFFGCLGSIALMLFIDSIIAAITTAIFLALWLFVHFYAPSVGWGEIAQALIFHQVRKYLLVLDTSRIHVQLWLPGVLLLVASPTGKGVPNLIDATNSLKKGGLFVVGSVLVGKWKETMRVHKKLTHEWAALVRLAKWKAFVDLIISPSMRQGVQSLLLTTGVGTLRPNTVVLGFHSEGFADPTPENLGHNLPDKVLEQIKQFPIHKAEVTAVEYVRVLKDINRANKNLLVARNFEKLDKRHIKKQYKSSLLGNSSPMTIDVWIVEEFVQRNIQTFNEFPHSYTGLYSNTSALLIQLGSILHTANMWKSYTKLRILSIVRGDMITEEHVRVSTILKKCNMNGKILVLPMAEKCSADYMNRVMRYHTNNTGITFFPLPQLPYQLSEYEEYLKDMDVLSQGIGPIYLVRSTNDTHTKL